MEPNLTPLPLPRRSFVAGTTAAIASFVALTVVVAVSSLSSQFLREVHAEVRAIRQRGEPIEPKDIVAICPTSLMEAKRAEQWLQLCTLAEPTGKFTDDVKPLPFLGDLQVSDDALSQPGSENIRQQARAFLEKHGEALRLAHELTSHAGPVAFQQNFEDGFNAKFPWVVSLRAFNRVLALELRLRVVDGDIEGAYSSWLVMLSLCESLRPMPCGVSCGVVETVRHSMLINAIKQAQFLLNQAALSDAQLVLIRDRLLDLKVERNLKQVMLGERIMGFVGFQHPEQIFDEPPNGKSVEANLATRAEDCLFYLETMRDFIGLCELPFAECRQRADVRLADELQRIEPLTRSGDDQFKGSLSLLRGANVFGIQSAAAPIAIRDATVLAVAARRFARRHNRLPANLDELVPEFCANVPIDPYTRSPFLFKSTSTGILIYSVGLNGIDEVNVEGSDDVSARIFEAEQR